MKLKNDIHHNRARAGSTIFAIALLLFIFFFGLTYLNPPPEDGIAINFGYEESGSGNTASSEKVTEPVEKSTQTETTPTETTPEIIDDVVTQETTDAPAVEKKEEEKQKVEKVEEKKEPVKEEEKKPSNDLLDRLDKTKNQKEASNNDGNKSGEGVKTGGGDQGDPNGDPKSQNREGNGGIGNSGNYRLGNRKALNKPKPDYVCNEEGRVVVKVYVNRSGKVVRAIPGEVIPNGPASTTAANCLLSKAKEAALKTTWHGDPNAAEQQQGYIIYNFSKN